ncbi:MBL fold metallo-hydrolase [Ornithinimicrobium pekingense]|uniref:Hydrolase n=1 Tax=Ornithinimicrobium pekingense TaxID=384677 RepID=A0ABQ2FAV7_9MICO|nr:MBL fold metallo-hydrolase [Ornithinimicrobium pekingense]GGK76318.1 hydrolase [Ornithinimicrobium pekingense]
MFVRSIVADAFGTNCYVLAPGPGEECLVVDPGIGVTDRVAEVLAEHRLRPAAVLLTHGHADHVWSVTPVCGGTTAAYIHGDDRYRLEDPLALLGEPVRAALEQQFGRAATWREPETVVEVTDRQTLELAGLQVDVAHAPGHTEGSVVFGLPALPHGIPADDLDRTVLSGDVLFAGSIGRTDLAGGDPAAMQRSLRDVVLPMADSTLVLPGHGPATTMARERTTNPYLQGLAG